MDESTMMNVRNAEKRSFYLIKKLLIRYVLMMNNHQ